MRSARCWTASARRIPPGLRIRDERFYSVVLFRAPTGIPQARCLALPDRIESRLLAPATINVRLAGVRRLAYEAADSGLLSPELAAGIQRVKGAKKLGVRLGNWLTVDECRRLLFRLDLGDGSPKGGLAYREVLRKASRHPATGAS